MNESSGGVGQRAARDAAGGRNWAGNPVYRARRLYVLQTVADYSDNTEDSPSAFIELREAVEARFYSL